MSIGSNKSDVIFSPVTDPVSFVTISFALESAGESAYLGALSVLQNKTTVTTAGVCQTINS